MTQLSPPSIAFVALLAALLAPACVIDPSGDPGSESEEGASDGVDEIDEPGLDTERYYVPVFCDLTSNTAFHHGHDSAGAYTCYFHTYTCNNNKVGNCTSCSWDANGLEKSSNCPAF